MDISKPNNDELQARCDDLQGQLIRYLKVEQDLINTRNSLDLDLARFKAIQSYSQKVIQVATLKEFAEITVESVVETFELECCAFFSYDTNSLKVEVLIGFDDEVKDTCNLDTEWIASMGFQKDRKAIIEKIQPDSAPMGSMGLSQVIMSPYYDDGGNLHGMLMGGISVRKKGYYDEITEELKPSFMVFTQQMGSLLRNFEAKQYLDLKVQKRTSEVVKQKKEIENQTREITDSIQYARRIQSALLPANKELDRLLPSYFILNKPRDIVSGDYYWVIQKDSKVIVAVADCTGHGVPGAFMSILGITFLNEIINKEIVVANEILNELRAKLIKSLRQTGKKDEARDGMEIGLFVVDFANKKLQYSGAFRPLYLIRYEELIEFKGDNMPIGLYGERIDSFSNNEIHIKEDDILYLFSDGYIDQIGGPRRKTFRAKKFKQLLIDIHWKPLHEQKAILEEEFERWRKDIEQIDDILVMGIKI